MRGSPRACLGGYARKIELDLLLGIVRGINEVQVGGFHQVGVGEVLDTPRRSTEVCWVSGDLGEGIQIDNPHGRRLSDSPPANKAKPQEKPQAESRKPVPYPNSGITENLTLRNIPYGGKLYRIGARSGKFTATLE